MRVGEGGCLSAADATWRNAQRSRRTACAPRRAQREFLHSHLSPAPSPDPPVLPLPFPSRMKIRLKQLPQFVNSNEILGIH